MDTGPCLSSSVADRFLKPTKDHRLGEQLPHQQSNPQQANFVASMELHNFIQSATRSGLYVLRRDVQNNIGHFGRPACRTRGLYHFVKKFPATKHIPICYSPVRYTD